MLHGVARPEDVLNPVSKGLLKVADLEQALDEEAAYQRTWLPPEPWWDDLVANKAVLCRSIHRQLQRGHQWPEAQVVNVRKPGHGVRPVALMDPQARVAYRALAAKAVPPEDRCERSAEAYSSFLLAPIRNGFPAATGLQILGSAVFGYVVVADLTAFYQYIDHALLSEELDLLEADLGVVDALVGLLADLAGRSFGIPQRSAPSDWLGDLYAARIERAAARHGLRVWRYSDDFRIGVGSWEEALQAIEVLADAARDVGVVLNESKLLAPTFITYLTHNSNAEIDDASSEIDPHDVEAAVMSDYAPDDDDQAVAAAEATVGRLFVGEPEPGVEDALNLEVLSADQNIALRWSLNTLTKFQNDAALEWAYDIFKYEPSLTHRVVRYLESLASSNPEVAEVLDQAVETLSLNEWQCAWFAYAYRSCVSDIDQSAQRVDWLTRQLNRWQSLGAAEAAVTLADHGAVEFGVLSQRLGSVPEDLSAWYLSAIARLNSVVPVPSTQLDAVRKSSALAAAIVP